MTSKTTTKAARKAASPRTSRKKSQKKSNRINRQRRLQKQLQILLLERHSRRCRITLEAEFGLELPGRKRWRLPANRIDRAQPRRSRHHRLAGESLHPRHSAAVPRKGPPSNAFGRGRTNYTPCHAAVSETVIAKPSISK